MNTGRRRLARGQNQAENSLYVRVYMAIDKRLVQAGDMREGLVDYRVGEREFLHYHHHYHDFQFYSHNP